LPESVDHHAIARKKQREQIAPSVFLLPLPGLLLFGLRLLDFLLRTLP
jgi:hypothetical protein